MPSIKSGTIFIRPISNLEIERAWGLELPAKYKGDIYRKPKLFIKASRTGNINWDKTQIFTDSDLEKIKQPIKII